MKLGRAALERFALAFQRAIENSLVRLTKDCEVHVSVVVKSKEEKNRGRPERDPGGDGEGHP